MEVIAMTCVAKLIGDIAHHFEMREAAGGDEQRFLQLELEEYEVITPMTEQERAALRDWVASGRSVHENGWYACWDGGIPMDFLDAYRQIQEEERLPDNGNCGCSDA